MNCLKKLRGLPVLCVAPCGSPCSTVRLPTQYQPEPGVDPASQPKPDRKRIDRIKVGTIGASRLGLPKYF